MPSFSKRSVDRLNSCNEDIQKVCHEVIKHYDFTVLCGHRGEEEQNEAFKQGRSNAKWGQSKHNTTPSRAIDIAPYPVDWGDKQRFCRLAGLMQGTAYQLGIKLKWGGDFKSIEDMPHFEIED